MGDIKPTSMEQFQSSANLVKDEQIPFITNKITISDDESDDQIKINRKPSDLEATYVGA